MGVSWLCKLKQWNIPMVFLCRISCIFKSTLPPPHVQMSVQKALDRDPESSCRNRSWSAWPWHLDVGEAAVDAGRYILSLYHALSTLQTNLHDNSKFQSNPNIWATRNHKSVAFCDGNQWSWSQLSKMSASDSSVLQMSGIFMTSLAANDAMESMETDCWELRVSASKIAWDEKCASQKVLAKGRVCYLKLAHCDTWCS